MVSFNSNADDGKYSPLKQDDMTESLVAPDPEDIAKPASSSAVIEVVAPATLMAGYELETEIGGQVVKVKVPAGGVARGQKFTVPMPTTVAAVTTEAKPRYQVPVGHWKDGLCDCTQHGVCHSTCCWGFFGLLLFFLVNPCCVYPPAALGTTQVATRMNLDWLGRPTANNSLQRGQTSAWYQFGRMTAFFMIFNIVTFLVRIALLEDASHQWGVIGRSKKADREMEAMTVFGLLEMASFVAYFVVCIVIIYNTRRQVRKSYSIPANENCPSDKMEDCCISTFCGCCAASQMLRHTGDYENYPASCCSSTGFPEYVNAIIV